MSKFSQFMSVLQVFKMLMVDPYEGFSNFNYICLMTSKRSSSKNRIFLQVLWQASTTLRFPFCELISSVSNINDIFTTRANNETFGIYDETLAFLEKHKVQRSLKRDFAFHILLKVFLFWLTQSVD